MKLLLDFPTIGEPHYAEAIPASLIMKSSQKIYKIEENKNPYAALGDKNALVVDMRDSNDRVKGTIPGSIGIPYTEIAMRMDELGCKKQPDGSKQKWDCSKAKNVYGFCNGPVCPQSPSAMNAMVRDGFPASKIYYYRGGMLDWDALGLTTVKGEF